ncbi:MAG TPA: DUF885 domain-containing protein [Gammaproteobacteria bacterium]|nr:DUF885 domain-containing protein [Gammaproteobacteria bacterium]
MRARFVLLLLMVIGMQSTTSAETSDDAAFRREFGDAFFDRYWQLNPDFAIASGYYKYADRLIVPDEKARAAQLEQDERWLKALHKIDSAKLSPNLRADWAILDNAITADRWSLTDFRPWQWNPSNYNVADPFALLMTLEYAPLEQRLRAILARLENVPAYYAAAKQSVANPTREHTRLAIEQNRGALDVFRGELEQKVAVAQLTSAERASFARRLKAARAAIEDYVAWLEALDARLASGEVRARSFRLGRELYARKFDLEIQSGEAAEQLYARALEEKDRLLARMTTLTDLLWPKYFPNAAPPEDRSERIGRLIAKLSERHVPREQFVAAVKRQIPELEQWVRDHDLIALDPTKPLTVRETPLYKRGIAGAGIDAPGPYDPGAPTYYNVTPLDDLTPERAESWLREYNDWMLPILNIHEAVPGHYVQLVYANKSPSLIKSIFANGAMIEGWAVYTERMMLESGYGGGTAESWLIYSKWNLRSVCNTILDYGVHVLDMSEADALRLLTRDAFQSDQEAAEKWRRVTLTSVQLTSYFSGYAAIYDLRERLKRERGAAFDLKKFHEQFLSYGNAPVAVIRELMQRDGG